MKKWIYKLIDSKDVPCGGIFKGRSRNDIEDYLCDIGDEGWEIINLDFRKFEGQFEFTGVAKKAVDV